MSDFKRGVGLGAGLATGWVLMLFVVLPLVFIGGCAVLIAASNLGGSGNSKRAQPFSAHDAAVLGTRARSNIRDFYPRAKPTSSRCAFVRRDTLGPDSWDYDCFVIVTLQRKPVRFRQSVQCFDPPHYVTFDSGNCVLNGDPQRI